MGIFDMIPFLGRDREKQTISLMKEHMAMVYRVVVELNNAFNALKEKNIVLLREKRSSISMLEGKADDIRRNIEENLYSGAFLPGSRSRILDFTEKVDEIADVAEDVAKLTAFLEEEVIAEELLQTLQMLLKETKDCAEFLSKCMDNMNDVEKIRSLVKEVGVKEHEIDAIEGQAFQMLYKGRYDAKDLMLLSKLIEYMGEISNRTEDASDALSLMILVHKP